MHTHIQLDQMLTSLHICNLQKFTHIFHHDYLVLCIMEGNMKYESEDNSELQASQGDIILLPPLKQLSLFPAPSAVCLIMTLDPAFLLDITDDATPFQQVYTSIHRQSLKELTLLVYPLAQIYHKQNSFGFHGIISALFSFGGRMNSLLCSSGKSRSQDSVSPCEKRIQTYLSGHIRETLSLQKTAEEIGLTPQYLASYFQKNYGCTFMEHVNHRKAELAAAWLRYTRAEPEEIASMTGFKTLSAFRKHVTGYLNTTPEAYRSSHQQDLPDCMPDPSTYVDDPFYYLQSSPFQSLNASSALVSSEPEFIYARIDTSSRLSDSWRMILNIGPATFMSIPELRSQLTYLQRKVNFRYGRLTRLLNLATRQMIRNQSFYGFENIFLILDTLLSLNLTPWLDLGKKNAKVSYTTVEEYILSENEEFHAYYEKVIQILPEFLRACCNRYGRQEVSKWYFEVYYDMIPGSSQPPFRHYLKYYQKLEQMIHDFIPECMVGGPGMNTFIDTSQAAEFFNEAREQQIRYDFISIYVYGTTEFFPKNHLTMDKNHVTQKTLRYTQIIHEIYPKLPVFVTEFNFCHTSRNFLNDSVFQTSFITRYLSNNLNTVQGMGYFTLSDISVDYTDHTAMFFGGNGLFNYQGIRKPSYYSYSFFKELGEYLLKKGEGYLLTCHSRYSIQGIFYRYAHIIEQTGKDENNTALLSSPERSFEYLENKTSVFRISGTVPGLYTVKTYSISHHSGNPLLHWAKFPYLSDLKEKDLHFFKYLSHPATSLFTLAVKEDGILEFAIALETMEMQLLLIEHTSFHTGQSQLPNGGHTQ